MGAFFATNSGEHSHTECLANPTNERTNQKTVRSLYFKVSRIDLDLEYVIPVSIVFGSGKMKMKFVRSFGCFLSFITSSLVMAYRAVADEP